MGALGKRMCLSCRVCRAVDRDTVTSCRSSGGRDCHSAFRCLFLCVWSASRHVGSDGVFAAKAIRLFLFADGTCVVSRVLYFFDGDVRLFRAYRKKTARLSLVADGGGVCVYGMLYVAGQRNYAVVVGVFSAGKAGVFLRVAILYDTAVALHGDYGRVTVLSPAEGVSAN